MIRQAGPGVPGAPTAPSAPGALGQALDPAAVAAYLSELRAWIATRRRELDDLDATALASDRQAQLTGDLTLSMALWKAISDRHQLLSVTFDGGRVLPQDRERLSVLIWGRLDSLAGSGSTTLAVSLPEACRLSDALASQLRVRLALDPAADEFTHRLKGMRAQLERLRDQALLEPLEVRRRIDLEIADFATRTDDLTARLERGGDVGGLIGPLENEAARLERDLIVGGVRRRESEDRLAAAQTLRAELAAKGPALRALAAQVVAEVDPAPNYAVPDVEALGPVPTDAAELTAYRARLDRVAAAMAKVHEAYAGALAQRDALSARLAAASVKASALAVTTRPDVASAEHAAREVLERRPAPLAVAGELLDVYEVWVRWWSQQPGPRAGEESA